MRTSEALVATLHEAGVETLVDVRGLSKQAACVQRAQAFAPGAEALVSVQVVRAKLGVQFPSDLA
jgi:hypothetical protein